MNVRILYSKKAQKFLEKNKGVILENEVDDLMEKAARLILKKENINLDLKKMKGTDINLYRIRKGKVRIIFTIIKNELVLMNVEDIGFRGNIY